MKKRRVITARNPHAKSLSTGRFKQRIVRPRKGKGSYVRSKVSDR